MKLLHWLGRLFDRDEPLPDREGETEAVDESTASPLPRSVTVGVDFGTSSTKVVFRDWNTKERTPHAVDFGVDLPGYTRFSRPSLIALKDGRIFFGQAAAEIQQRNGEGQLLRSAKVELLEAHVDPPSVDIQWQLPNALAARGASTLEGLVTLYLADTIRRAVLAAREVYPDLKPSELAFNLDVPVGQLDEGPVAERFQRIIDVAISLASEIRDEMALAEALDLWTGILVQVQKDPPKDGERPGELVPEAEAVIQGVGAVLGSRPSDLYHAIVDVGAGTTDVGWFKLVVTTPEDRLPFFAARTRRVGCNDIDEQLAAHVADGSSVVLEEVGARLVQAKPNLISGDECTIQVEDREITVRPQDLAEAANQVAPHIYEHYSNMFGPAYKKEKNTDRWEHIRVAVVGGGSLIPEVRNLFDEHPRTFGKEAELIDLSIEMELRTTGASDRAPTRSEKPFLTAALGLSHPKFVMPDPIMPSEIDEDLDDRSEPTGLYDYKIDY